MEYKDALFVTGEGRTELCTKIYLGAKCAADQPVKATSGTRGCTP
jgi:hypothetical protein